MASFNALCLACFDGKCSAFNKFNAGTGYKAQGMCPNKVNFCALFHISSLLFCLHSRQLF